MTHFEGHEQKRAHTFQSLIWAKEEFLQWFTEEDRQRMQESEFKPFPVTWTGDDFSRHEGTRAKSR